MTLLSQSDMAYQPTFQARVAQAMIMAAIAILERIQRDGLR